MIGATPGRGGDHRSRPHGASLGVPTVRFAGNPLPVPAPDADYRYRFQPGGDLVDISFRGTWPAFS